MSPQQLRGHENELIMPNKTSSHSTLGGFRPLSRTLTSLKPKLFFGKGKSEIATNPTRPPIPSSVSESSDIGATTKQQVPTLERRSTIIGSPRVTARDSREPVNNKTKQEISENLRRMVLEEKQKLQTSAKTPEERKVAQEPKIAPDEEPISQPVQSPPSEKEVVAPTKKADEYTSNIDTFTKRFPPSPAPASPTTAKKESEEISNMFDSIFDWYPAKTGTPPRTPETAECFESPSAAHSQAEELTPDDDESFDQAFDDILGALNKLRA
jgi:hypothetical protein